jgi:hypothetical protein
MQLTMHEFAVIPVMRGLAALSLRRRGRDLRKGAEHCSRGSAPGAVISGYAALRRAIQRASDTTKAGMGRLTGGWHAKIP